MDNLNRIKNAIRDVPDFPKEGILFKDITPVLNDKKLFKNTIDIFSEEIEKYNIDYIAGIESRGFIFASALAVKLNKGFVPIRKPGKLPYKTYHESYALEYGTDSLEIHQDAVPGGASVVLVDDLLATGGTALAAVKLLEQCNAKIELVQFLIELTFLEGNSKLKAYNCKALIKY
jgi:adenine phosphoribosyltransferase